MENKFDNHIIQQQKSSDIQPSQLISFISLSHYELHKLVNDIDAFINKVTKLNNQAKQKIQQKLYKQALLLLNEAQKILQYAAGSGKSIDRDLIVSVLHNLSCTYQNLWILQKCSTYIQGMKLSKLGLIFNLDNHLLSLQSSISSAQINQNSYEKTSTYEIKKSLAIYQLKFLAINSQLKQHRIALNSGKKALSTLKQIMLENEVYIKRLMKQEYQKVYQTSSKVTLDKREYDSLIISRYSLISEILAFSENIEVSSYKNLIKAAHFSYQIFLKQKYLGQEHPFASYFKKYSIGNVMEIQPLTFFKKQALESWKVHNKVFDYQKPQQSLIYKFILLSISFFSIGTQMRILLYQQKQISGLAKQNDQRYRQSDIMHLLAIITLTTFVPFEILYLKHLLNSYKLHYNSDFFDYKTVQSQSISKIIYLISGKKTQKTQLYIPSDNQYHLKERIFDKKTQKHIQSIRKTKRTQGSKYSKQKKSTHKTISFLENKSTIIQKDYPTTTTASKSKSSKDKTSTQKSKSKLKRKSKDMNDTIKKPDIIKRHHSKKKSLNLIENAHKSGVHKSKSKSKSKKKSHSKYDSKYKSGSNSSSNKQTYFASRQIGLSSILENGVKSKLQKQQKKQPQIHINSNGLNNGNINLRKIKSHKNLKQFISRPLPNSKSNRNKSNEHNKKN